jgi:hypothetical protein
MTARFHSLVAKLSQPGNIYWGVAESRTRGQLAPFAQRTQAYVSSQRTTFVRILLHYLEQTLASVGIYSFSPLCHARLSHATDVFAPVWHKTMKKLFFSIDTALAALDNFISMRSGMGQTFHTII